MTGVAEITGLAARRRRPDNRVADRLQGTAANDPQHGVVQRAVRRHD